MSDKNKFTKSLLLLSDKKYYMPMRAFLIMLSVYCYKTKGPCVEIREFISLSASTLCNNISYLEKRGLLKKVLLGNSKKEISLDETEKGRIYMKDLGLL